MQLEYNVENFSELTLKKPHFMDDPYEVYRTMRKESPVFFDSKMNVYFITSYQLIHEVLKNAKLFSSANDPLVMTIIGNEQDVKELYEKEGGWLPVPILSTTDPPELGPVRSIVEKSITLGTVKRMNPAIRQIANELVDSFPSDGKIDFHEKFAKRLPLYVIADLIGVPRVHEDLLHRMADATTAMADGGTRTRAEILNLHRTQIEGQKVCQKLIEQYRVKPEENILSQLAASRFDDGCALTDRQIHSLLQLLLVGGNDTTPGALSNGMLVLARDHELQNSLRSDLTLLPKFIDEILRFEGPVAGLYRRATRDTVLGGVAIPAGATVNCRLNAANRDAERFEDPDAFDIARKGIRNHLGFGYGVHYCVGVNLARAEMTIGWETLLSRLVNLRLQSSDFQPKYQDKLSVRNPVSLPIAFDFRN